MQSAVCPALKAHYCTMHTTQMLHFSGRLQEAVWVLFPSNYSSTDCFLSQRNRRPDLSTNIQTFRATFQCLVTIQLNVSLEVQVSMSDHDSIEQFSLFQNIGSIIQIFYYDCFVVFFLFKYQNKVNRCLARYSPRATTTNQPTVH